MRVAIIVGYFLRGRGYQENVWAERLHLQGHQVCVFTTCWTPPGIDHDPEAPPEPFEMQRLRARRLPKATMLSWSLGRRVAEWQPECILWFGAGQYFGYTLLRKAGLKDVPVASFFGQCASQHEFDWTLPGIGPKARLRAFAHHVLRGPIIRAACRRSQLIVANTMQTRPILLRQFRSDREREEISRKIVEMPLGFSPDVFSLDERLRGEVRKELGFDDAAVVICMSSRVTDGKRAMLEQLITAIKQCLDRDPRANAMFIGLSDNAPSRYLRQVIESGPSADRFRGLGFANRQRLNALYNASDIALFGQASISCQESLGTGLFVCIGDDGSTSHLISGPDQGVFFAKNDVAALADTLCNSVAAIASHDASDEGRLAFRRQMAEKSQWLSYDRIVSRVMEHLSEWSVAARGS
ncbi:MAG: glycosyltransferase family 4 protein [Planctomycetes bacterium]|nr:glycosyltransferase family 4 protein [Planctomycetota bacterium]